MGFTPLEIVDEGANPDAHIRMIKSKDGAGQAEGEDNRHGSGRDGWNTEKSVTAYMKSRMTWKGRGKRLRKRYNGKKCAA